MARYRVGLQTRGRILEATRALLGDVGFEQTTLKAICDSADIGSGSFYNLFESKDDAILEVVREAIASVDPDPTGAGSETLADLMFAWVAFFETQPTLARVYLRIAVTGAFGERDVAARVLRHHQARTARFARAIVRSSDCTVEQAEQAAEMLAGTLTGLAVRWMVAPDFDLKGHTQRLLDGEVASALTQIAAAGRSTV